MTTNQNSKQEAIKFLEGKIAFHQECLAEDMLNLGDFLIRRANKVAKGGNVSAAGEIRGRALSIDCRCARLDTLRDALLVLKSS